MSAVVSEYKKALVFLRRMLLPLLMLSVLFLAVAVASHYIFAAHFRDDAGGIEQRMAELKAAVDSKDLLDTNGELSAVKLFYANFIAVGISVVTGMVPFLFIPLVTLAVNASVIGMLSAVMAVSDMGGMYELAVSVAPHGVIEIPAMIIGTAMGLKLCADVTARILLRRQRPPFSSLVFEMARLSVLVVVPLLTIAAALETYVTPLLMAALL